MKNGVKTSYPAEASWREVCFAAAGAPSNRRCRLPIVSRPESQSPRPVCRRMPVRAGFRSSAPASPPSRVSAPYSPAAEPASSQGTLDNPPCLPGRRAVAPVTAADPLRPLTRAVPSVAPQADCGRMPLVQRPRQGSAARKNPATPGTGLRRWSPGSPIMSIAAAVPAYPHAAARPPGSTGSHAIRIAFRAFNPSQTPSEHLRWQWRPAAFRG